MFLRFLLGQLLFLADWWSGSTVSYYCDKQVRSNSSIIVRSNSSIRKSSEIKFLDYCEKLVISNSSKLRNVWIYNYCILRPWRALGKSMLLSWWITTMRYPSLSCTATKLTIINIQANLMIQEHLKEILISWIGYLAGWWETGQACWEIAGSTSKKCSSKFLKCKPVRNLILRFTQVPSRALIIRCHTSILQVRTNPWMGLGSFRHNFPWKELGKGSGPVWLLLT